MLARFARASTDPGNNSPAYDTAKAAIIRFTSSLAWLAAQGIRVNCLAPGWIATGGPRQYWQSLTPEQRVERGVPARLIEPHEIANAVVKLVDDSSLSGRTVVWWSDKQPSLIAWGDRGYERDEPFAI